MACRRSRRPSAPRLGERRTRWFTTLLLAVALIGTQLLLASQRRARGGASDAVRLETVAGPHGGCLFVYDGPPALYRLTHNCLPSCFVFSGHLDPANERARRGWGVAPVVENHRIMASRPASVMIELPLLGRGNRSTLAVVIAEVARH
jgi:hypothetical protein